ncbi:butyrophilin-like protein 1 [Anabas testudineus]|uniref:butyrophilin-like protein 1 n=1 Tax=Anabas testudineus TaxID=64144 RepID=UPI00143DF9B3|nr:butyrophilin-like protein 1 [Anabas testudineus]
MESSAETSLLVFHSFLLVSSLTLADQLTVKPGDDVVLQSQAPTEAVIRLLEWIRPDLKSDGDVFFYRNDRSYEKYQHPSYRGRVELKDPKMKDGDVSVILKNVNINDTGTYECRIISSITINERTSSELRHILHLTVVEPGTSVAANIYGDVKPDKIISGGENNDVKLGLGLSFALLFVSVGALCLLKFRNHLKCSKQHFLAVERT